MYEEYGENIVHGRNGLCVGCRLHLRERGDRGWEKRVGGGCHGSDTWLVHSGLNMESTPCSVDRWEQGNKESAGGTCRIPCKWYLYIHLAPTSGSYCEARRAFRQVGRETWQHGIPLCS